MDFVEGVIDEGVRELNVTGVAGIERISQNQMRITYFVRRKNENIAVVHLVWDREQWMQQWLQWERVRADINSELFELPTTEDGVRREMH